MKTLALLLLLCALTPLISCQKSTKKGTPLKPDSGNLTLNTYRNDFFGFSYPVPGEWHQRRNSPYPLPSGAYYLFTGSRNEHSPLNRVTIVADPESDNRPRSAQEYLSALIAQTDGEVTREPSSFGSGGSGFYREDYRVANNGTTAYTAYISIVCIKRKNYWLYWSFVAPSQRDLEDAVNTVQHVSFDNPLSRQQ
jgi:hypothetical protein